MFQVQAHYIGAWGSKFLAASNLSSQEALDYIASIKKHIECVLKSDVHTRNMLVHANVEGDRTSLYVVDPSKMYNSSRLLCILSIESEKL